MIFGKSGTHRSRRVKGLRLSWTLGSDADFTADGGSIMKHYRTFDRRDTTRSALSRIAVGGDSVSAGRYGNAILFM